MIYNNNSHHIIWKTQGSSLVNNLTNSPNEVIIMIDEKRPIESNVDYIQYGILNYHVLEGMADLVRLFYKNGNIIFANTNANGVSRSLLSLTNSPLKESRNNLSDLDNRSFDFDKRTAAGKSSGNLTGIKAEQLQLATTLSGNGGATHTLSIGNKSVAVDAGYTEKTPETDQRNYSR